MVDIVNNIVYYATELIRNGGIIIGFLMIVLEAIFSVLPLTAFVALNINAFGWFIGFTVSYFAAVTGGYLAFFIFRKLTDKFIGKWLLKKNRKSINRGLDKFKNIKFSSLVLILSLPFTPGSIVNLLAGLSNMGRKKYFYSLVIGKVFVILFWGFVGKSFIDRITNINTLVILSIMLLVAYGISKFVNKKYDLE